MMADELFKYAKLTFSEVFRASVFSTNLNTILQCIPYERLPKNFLLNATQSSGG